MKLKNLFASDKNTPGRQLNMDEIGECCGEHEVCEKDLLLKSLQQGIEYYDDEELDVFKGYSSDTYSEDEVDMFREVFYTMWESDVPGWTRSLQLRGIELPDGLKDEVLLILNS